MVLEPLQDSHFALEARLHVDFHEVALRHDFAGEFRVRLLVDREADHRERATADFLFEDVGTDFLRRNDLRDCHETPEMFQINVGD